MTGLMKQIGNLILIVFFAVAVIVFSMWAGTWLGKSLPVPPTLRSMGPTVTQLERLGELTTTRVHVTDVLTAEGGTAN